MTTIEAPADLAERGAAYWQAITAVYGLSDSERELLRETCRCLDQLDHLAEAINRDGTTVTGSAGQTVVHPAITAANSTRTVLHRLIAALALPDATGAVVPSTTSTRAQKAAQTRWRDHVKMTAGA